MVRCSNVVPSGVAGRNGVCGGACVGGGGSRVTDAQLTHQIVEKNQIATWLESHPSHPLAGTRAKESYAHL